MGLIEEYALLRKSIDIGSLCLRMSSKTSDPVIQIVDSNEQDVRSIRRVSGMRRSFTEKNEQHGSEHPRAGDAFE